MTELVLVGGPETLARHAAADAAEMAARHEREFWLGILEKHIDALEDFHDRLMCDTYIRELRRKLGIKPPKELTCEQTRERVGEKEVV